MAFLMIMLYVLGIALLVVLIILGIKLIYLVDRANVVVGDIEKKTQSLNRFFDVIDGVTDKNGEKIGTGMGLYIAKSIIDDYKDTSITITKILDGFGIRVIFRKI